MKSLKNHLSLIIALATILFTLQIFVIVDRSINAYEKNLKEDYSLIVVAKKALDETTVQQIDELIASSEEISPEHIVDDLKEEMKERNLKLLKLSLPKFYRIGLKHFPTPDEIERLSENLIKHPLITRVEDFAQSHDQVYKLLLLFKTVTQIFALSILAVTSLLIIKELRLWQFQHSERMSIMALFGAPVWLRSAVLFRLAIVDAVVASLLVNGAFFLIVQYGWVGMQLETIGISVTLYDLLTDGVTLSAVALSLSVLLATMIVMGHKEEV